MENRTFVGFSNASLHDDGLKFNLTIDTLEGPVPIEASVADIGKMIHLLSKVSWAAGHIQRLPQHFVSDGTLSLRPVDATALAVAAGEPGKTLVMMLVGATTLAYALDTPKLKGFSHQLQTTVAGLV